MYTTQKFQRSIHQPATGIGAIGAMSLAVCPPLGIALLVAAFFMQRNFTRKRRAIQERQHRRAVERQQQVRILALKSLR